jgi:TfoX/Sxy family transcriptional regulator of competence genes
MDWKKPSVEEGKRLEEALRGIPCRSRPMFGCPAWFADDRMFAGVYGDDLFVRTSPADREDLLARYPGSRAFEPMPGRRMKDYLVLPEEARADREILVRILERSFETAKALPPKAGKTRRQTTGEPGTKRGAGR